MVEPGTKEGQLRSLREKRAERTTQERPVTTKRQTKTPAAKAPANAKTKRARDAGVDRSPLAVGTFIARAGGASMADLEKQFKMDAHPMRAKIHSARHQLGFAINYDAEKGRYFGTEPKHKAAKAA